MNAVASDQHRGVRVAVNIVAHPLVVTLVSHMRLLPRQECVRRKTRSMMIAPNVSINATASIASIEQQSRVLSI